MRAHAQTPTRQVWQAAPELLLVKVDAAAMQRWQEHEQQQERRQSSAHASPSGGGGPQLLSLRCASERVAAELAAACERAVAQVCTCGACWRYVWGAFELGPDD